MKEKERGRDDFEGQASPTLLVAPLARGIYFGNSFCVCMSCQMIKLLST
jgi:hypothetical protein